MTDFPTPVKIRYDVYEQARVYASRKGLPITTAINAIISNYLAATAQTRALLNQFERRSAS